ncbi:unnamed protein product [Rhodiola kirilowii]
MRSGCFLELFRLIRRALLLPAISHWCFEDRSPLWRNFTEELKQLDRV